MIEPIDLPPPPDGTPCGPNLEADAEDFSFGELERAAKGKAEVQFGNTVTPAVLPDWKEVGTLALDLLGRTRDLRVMVILCMARLNRGDMPGFAAGLKTIRVHLETMWADVHPQPDPEEPNDTVLRANSLEGLLEHARVLRPLREFPLASQPRQRAVAWRDIAVLRGQAEAEPGREPMNEAEVRDTFAKTDPAQLATLREALASVLDDLVGIPAAFETAAGPGSGPDFDPLVKVVAEIAKEVTGYAEMAAASAAGSVEDDGEAEGREDVGQAVMGIAAPRPAGASIQAIVAINTRKDALHALTLAAAYFRLHEPSSPLPLLIDRACRLAPMPFLDILRDLAPDGLMQAQVVVGEPGPG